MTTDTPDPETVAEAVSAKRRCPECGTPTIAAFRPFCSRRCRDIDLGRWLDGGYRIPREAPPDGFDEDGLG